MPQVFSADGKIIVGTGINPEGYTEAWLADIRPIYTVTTSAGAGGIIAPPSREVTHGQTTIFTVTPDTGYSIDSVTGCGGTLSDDTYTTGPITSDCTVSATFSLNTYIVTATAGPGGFIFPPSREVSHGRTTTFTFIPMRKYAVDSVTGCGGTLSSNPFPGFFKTYTTGPITSDCTVSATFKSMFPGFTRPGW